MAVTAKWYGKAILNAFGGEAAGEAAQFDWLSDTIKVMLCTALTIDQDGDEFMSDVIKTEVASGNGYTTRGTTLTGKTLTYNASTNVINFDADDALWSSPTTITAAYAIIYKDSGTDSTSPLLGYVDFGGNVSSASADYKVIWNANGIFSITVT